MVEVLGDYAAPTIENGMIETNEPEVGPEGAFTAAPYYFSLRKTSIFAGSNEVQRNIMAKAVLGL
jgi:alkylation response protein AidB-like acyl-CoA dehydrogenase